MRSRRASPTIVGLIAVFLAATGISGCGGTSAPAKSQTEASAPDTQGFYGIGQSRAAWDATHHALPGYAKGAVYGPMIGRQPSYAGVDGDDYIGSYTLNFEPMTTLDGAMAEVYQNEIPDDVKVTDLPDSDPRCDRVVVTSPLLHQLRGDVEISLTYFSNGDGPLDPRSVDFAVFTIVPTGASKGFRC